MVSPPDSAPQSPVDGPLAVERLPIGVGDLFRLAATFALCFGTLEAIEAAALRHVPQIQALGKTSLAVLWVAPVFHLAVNLLLAAGLGVARLAVPIPAALAAGLFAFTGALGVILYSGLLGRPSSVLLALGVAVQVGRLGTRAVLCRGCAA